MKIGLLRHFKVDIETPKRCNSSEFNRICNLYDTSDIIPPRSMTPIAGYTLCYSSTLKRAEETARIVFPGEIILSDDLKEVGMNAIFQTNREYSFTFWKVIHRVWWAFNSNRATETRKQTLERAARFLTHLIDSTNDNTLLVTHGFYMTCLHEVLNKMKFKGKPILSPKYGSLYEYIK